MRKVRKPLLNLTPPSCGRKKVDCCFCFSFCNCLDKKLFCPSVCRKRLHNFGNGSGSGWLSINTRTTIDTCLEEPSNNIHKQWRSALTLFIKGFSRPWDSFSASFGFASVTQLIFILPLFRLYEFGCCFHHWFKWQCWIE